MEYTSEEVGAGTLHSEIQLCELSMPVVRTC